MPETILHHYPLSPYSEKIRLALGLKGLRWRSVEIPVWTPRPKLTPMTGGYRRTPILQVGAEFYCDTLLILRVIEELGSSKAPYALAAARRWFGGSRRPKSLYPAGQEGTVKALKDLADKTRRGLRGRIEAGKAGGGLCYGYDVVKRSDAAGEPIRGERGINEAEAQIVHRIFREFAAGKSPRAIAVDLNREGEPGPFGNAWGDTTIRGHACRGNGILAHRIQRRSASLDCTSGRHKFATEACRRTSNSTDNSQVRAPAIVRYCL